ncbi:hypothetical protein [Geodermatophilus sp. SYSU D00079]
MTRRGLRKRLETANRLTAAHETGLSVPLLVWLSEHGPATADQVAAALGVPWTRATVALSALHVVGLVTLDREGESGPVVYALPFGVRVVLSTGGVPA